MRLTKPTSRLIMSYGNCTEGQSQRQPFKFLCPTIPSARGESAFMEARSPLVQISENPLSWPPKGMRMNTKQALVILAAVLWGIAAEGAAGAEEEGNLPIVTGNFSVTWIQRSPVGAFPDPNFNGEGVPPPENWAGHRKAGLTRSLRPRRPR